MRKGKTREIYRDTKQNEREKRETPVKHGDIVQAEKNKI